MPNCFQLTRNGEAIPLAQVDDEMREHFKEPPDPDRYMRQWYDWIGYELAMGRTFDDIRKTYDTPEFSDLQLVPLIEWLAENFSPRSWYEPK